MCVAFVLSSCVKHDIYMTEHPDKGALVVTADFSSRSAEANVPTSYLIALSTGEEWGEAAKQTVQGETNVIGKLLEPATYNMLVYNVPDGINVSGTVATVNSVQTKSSGNPLEIEATPDYLFGAYKQISIAEDDTTWGVAKMKQYVKLLNISLNVKEGDYGRIAKVTCALSGVVASVDLATGTLGDYSAFVSNDMKIDGNKMTTAFRLLGVAPSERQILTVTITYTNGDEDMIDSDISDVIDDINNDDGGGSGGDDGKTPDIDISGDVKLPVGSGFSATIDGWQQTDGSGITAK